MQGITLLNRNRFSVASALLVTLLMLSACSIRLISAYDETTDKAVTALQNKTETHFVALESLEGRPGCEYEKSKVFYDQAKVDISAIEVRAAAIPKNEITTLQAQLLAQNLEALRKLHKISCLSVWQIDPLRIQFNSSYTAILKEELAKRRGE
jgi:hypothetical protein